MLDSLVLIGHNGVKLHSPALSRETTRCAPDRFPLMVRPVDSITPRKRERACIAGDPGYYVSNGYGESQLLNRCADGVNCSESDHQINRRTEFKVICP